jgi:hypothetical protein
VTWDRVVAKRATLDPFVKAAGVDCIGVESQREQRSDKRAHADPQHTVDRHASGRQLFEHADVRKRACATAGENDANRLTAQPARDSR